MLASTFGDIALNECDTDRTMITQIEKREEIRHKRIVNARVRAYPISFLQPFWELALSLTQEKEFRYAV